MAGAVRSGGSRDQRFRAVLALAVLLGGVQFGCEGPGKSMLNEKKELLARVKRLHAARCTEQMVSEQLCVVLRRDAARSTDFFELKTAERGLVEVRIPGYRSTMKGLILTVDVEEKLGLSRTDIVEAFGQPDEIQVPKPPSGTGEAVVYVYKGEFGQLRFGLGPGPQELVKTVVIDQSED
jgi:hypothetical protein